MPVMDVRKVRMSVDEGVMLVSVDMRFGASPRKIVAMPMVLVVPMRVFVSRRLVCMNVFMAFGEMKVDSQRHQCTCSRKLQRQRFMQDQ